MQKGVVVSRNDIGELYFGWLNCKAPANMPKDFTDRYPYSQPDDVVAWFMKEGWRLITAYIAPRHAEWWLTKDET